MKNSVYLLLCIVTGIVFYQALLFLGLPFWAVFLLFPFLAYAQIYVSNRYSFRQSLDFEPLPEKGYESRIRELRANEQTWQALGFRKFDEFYLRLSNDVVGFVYHHESYPIVACDYHFGGAKASDLMTRFEDERSLTTSNTPSGGLIPRPNEKMLQVFAHRPPHELLARHLQAGQFLHEKGLRLEKIFLNDFRPKFLEGYHQIGREACGVLGPVKVFYWMASGRKKSYMKPVQEQFLARTLLLDS